jgi:hypothetical protein
MEDELLMFWVSLLFPALALLLLYVNKSRASRAPPAAAPEARRLSTPPRSLSPGRGSSSSCRAGSASDTRSATTRRTPHLLGYDDAGGSQVDCLRDAGDPQQRRRPRAADTPPGLGPSASQPQQLTGKRLLNQAALALQSYADRQLHQQRELGSARSTLSDLTTDDYVDSEYYAEQAAPGFRPGQQPQAPSLLGTPPQALSGGPLLPQARLAAQQQEGAGQQSQAADSGGGSGGRRLSSSSSSSSATCLTDFQKWWQSQQEAEQQAEDSGWQPDQQLAALRQASSHAGLSVPTAPRRGIRHQHSASSMVSSSSASASGGVVYHQQQQMVVVNPESPGGAARAGMPPQEAPPGGVPGAPKTVPGWQQRAGGQPETLRAVRRNLAGG